MARPLRVEYPGAFYHITSRGNAGDRIFRSDRDRRIFLEVLGETVEQFRWICHAYCLMENHYHLVIETPQANLSRGMRHLNGVYTQKYNWHHSRMGHVFQGRFKAIVVDRDSYLLELSRYVALNPVRANIVKHPGEWKWSSYLATAGKDRLPVFLTTDFILALFAKRRSRAQELYASFVMEGVTRESPWKELKGQIFLGDNDFIRRCKSLLSHQESLEVPRRQRHADRPPLEALFNAEGSKKDRNERITRAFCEYAYTLQEIADALGIHYSSVSRIARAGKKMIKYKT